MYRKTNQAITATITKNPTLADSGDLGSLEYHLGLSENLAKL